MRRISEIPPKRGSIQKRDSHDEKRGRNDGNRNFNVYEAKRQWFEIKCAALQQQMKIAKESFSVMQRSMVEIDKIQQEIITKSIGFRKEKCEECGRMIRVYGDKTYETYLCVEHRRGNKQGYRSKIEESSEFSEDYSYDEESDQFSDEVIEKPKRVQNKPEKVEPKKEEPQKVQPEKEEPKKEESEPEKKDDNAFGKEDLQALLKTISETEKPKKIQKTKIEKPKKVEEKPKKVVSKKQKKESSDEQ